MKFYTHLDRVNHTKALKDRRERGDMIEVYKLLTGREQIDYKQFFKPAKNLSLIHI